MLCIMGDLGRCEVAEVAGDVAACMCAHRRSALGGVCGLLCGVPGRPHPGLQAQRRAHRLVREAWRQAHQPQGAPSPPPSMSACLHQNHSHRDSEGSCACNSTVAKRMGFLKELLARQSLPPLSAKPWANQNNLPWVSPWQNRLVSSVLQSVTLYLLSGQNRKCVTAHMVCAGAGHRG